MSGRFSTPPFEKTLSHKILSQLHEVLENLEKPFHPDLFILGGQLSRKADSTFPYIRINTSFRPASFLNDASIVGAAK